MEFNWGIKFDAQCKLCHSVVSKALVSKLKPGTCVDFNRMAGIPAAALKTQYWYDLTGSSTFAILALASVGLVGSSVSFQHCIVATAVLLWAARLGSFLFIRIIGDGGVDHRLSKYSDKPIAFILGPWTVQGMWVAATMLPVLVLFAGESAAISASSGALFGRLMSMPLLVAAGWQQLLEVTNVSGGILGRLGELPIPLQVLLCVWLLAYIVQFSADEGKRQFKAVPKNHGKFIRSGIWTWSQHPNYAGELVMWHALGCAACYVAYTSPTHVLSGSPLAFVSLAGPFMEALLIIFVSGVPLLDKAAAKKWGGNSNWLAYAKNTPVLFPCCPAFPRRPTEYVHKSE